VQGRAGKGISLRAPFISKCVMTMTSGQARARGFALGRERARLEAHRHEGGATPGVVPAEMAPPPLAVEPSSPWPKAGMGYQRTGVKGSRIVRQFRAWKSAPLC
jgi:hypothetical protein